MNFGPEEIYEEDPFEDEYDDREYYYDDDGGYDDTWDKIYDEEQKEEFDLEMDCW
jgi:hypothetical protein